MPVEFMQMCVAERARTGERFVRSLLSMGRDGRRKPGRSIMPEQPQWSERTLDMPPQDPWADPPTVPDRPTAGSTAPTEPHRASGQVQPQRPGDPGAPPGPPTRPEGVNSPATPPAPAPK